MAYNYSLTFLHANADYVRQLIELADSNAYKAYRFADPGTVRKAQHRVNNLLASLASYHPERAYVRRNVRTWIERDAKGWLLMVGVPPHGTRLGGRPPDPITFEPAGEIRPGEVRITEPITPQNWPDIAIKLAKAKLDRTMQRVVIEQPPEQAGVDYILERLAPEFSRDPNSPGLVLTRS